MHEESALVPGTDLLEVLEVADDDRSGVLLAAMG